MAAPATFVADDEPAARPKSFQADRPKTFIAADTKTATTLPKLNLQALNSERVNQPSEYSSGLPASVPKSDNPDWAFTQGIARDPVGFLKSLPADAQTILETAAAGGGNLPARAYRALPDSVRPYAKPLLQALTSIKYTAAAEPGKEAVFDTSKTGGDLAQDKPLPFAPGKPVWTPRGTVLQPEGNAVQKLVSGFTTPGMIASFPFAATKAAQAYFLAQTAPGAIDAATRLVDPATLPEARKEAATDLLINGVMSYGLARGLVLRPALMVDGKPLPGTAGQSHAEIAQTAPADIKPKAAEAVKDDANHVFLNADDEVLTRKEAAPVAEAAGVTVAKPDEGLHSEDLTKAINASKPANVETSKSSPPAASLNADEIKAALTERQIVPSENAETLKPEALKPEDAGETPVLLGKLIPVEVSDADIEAMRTDAEHAPDVLDDIANVTSKPVKFAEKDYATTIEDARGRTLTAAGRPSAATKRLGKLISANEGEPADKVLQALSENPKYADWSRDDLANAIIAAHEAKESGGGDSNARILAETHARDAMFIKANKPTRPGVESVPVEHLFVGDTFKLNGHEMTVTGFPVDAETGQPFGVELDGAYGRQTVQAGQAVHLDEESLKAPEAPAEMALKETATVSRLDTLAQRVHGKGYAELEEWQQDAIRQAVEGRGITPADFTPSERFGDRRPQAASAEQTAGGPARELQPARAQAKTGGKSPQLNRAEIRQLALSHLARALRQREAEMADDRRAGRTELLVRQELDQANDRSDFNSIAAADRAYTNRLQNNPLWVQLQRARETGWGKEKSAQQRAIEAEAEQHTPPVPETTAQHASREIQFEETLRENKKGYTARVLARLDALKLDTRGQMHAFGLLPEAWNTLIDLMKLGVRSGKSVADAVNAAIARFKRQYPKQEFDEAGAREHLAQAFAKPKPAEAAPGKAPEKTTSEELKPEMVGMGGAVPGEFRQSTGTPTGIKVAAIDAQRAARGEEPLSAVGRRSFGGEVWPATLAKVDADPDAPKTLVDKLAARQEAGEPVALTDADVAMLLYREADLSYQRAKALRDLAQASDDAQQFPDRAGQAAELKLDAARLQDELDKLERVIQPARSDTGRGLAALRHMVGDNYTLEAMTYAKRAANDGKPLTAEQVDEVRQAYDREQATRKAYEDLLAKTEAERAQRLLDEELAARIKVVEQTPGYDEHVASLADRIVAYWDAEAVKSRAWIKANAMKFSAGVDPMLLKHVTVIGISHITRGLRDKAPWLKRMVDDFGEHSIPYLNKIWTDANNQINQSIARMATGKKSLEVMKRVRKEDVTGTRAALTAKLKDAAAQRRPLAEQGDFIRQLMENFIRSGITKREPLIDAVHELLTKEAGLDVTRRETMEAMSGYGRYRALDPDAIKATRRDLGHQIAQTLKLADITARQPLPKSGVEQHTPSTEGRLLEQQVNEAKRRYGVVVTDPAKQLKGALDARKTGLKNRIADLEFQIARKERFVKTKTETKTDPEVQLLEFKRDQLKQQLDEIAPRPGLTDAQRLAQSEARVAAEIEHLEQRIAGNDVLPKPGRPALTSAKLDALKARRDALRAERDELRAQNPAYKATMEQRALKAYLARLTQQNADLAERAARGDFTARPKRVWSWTGSTEAMAAKAANQAARIDFQRQLVRDRQSKRSQFEKGMDGISKWKRTFVLSWPTVLGKLVAAAIENIAIIPLEEAAGSGTSRLFPAISERAPRHGGGLNLRAEADAISETVVHLVTDFKQGLKTGQTDVTLVHNRPVLLPPELKDYVGNLHFALKTPLLRNEYVRSFTRLMRANADRGVDISEPLVQLRISNEASVLAQKAIFKENTLVARMYRRALSATRDQVDGNQTRTGKIAETALRFTFPIVDIPTTIVKRTFEYSFGLPTGLGRAAWAYHKGIENLKPDEAEAIMRNLKRGSLGAAVLALGFFNANEIGGYYAPGQKREAGDVALGGIKIFGHEIPRYLVHNPLLEQLQIGATIRRVADSRMRPRDRESQGIGAGAWAAMLGLVSEVPFMQGTEQMFSQKTPQNVIGEPLKSMIPGVLQFTANELDQPGKMTVGSFLAPHAISRKPETIWQTVEMGVPGLRQNVPARVTADVAPAVDYFSRKFIPKGTPPDVRAALWSQLAEQIKRQMAAKYTNAPAGTNKPTGKSAIYK